MPAEWTTEQVEAATRAVWKITAGGITYGVKKRGKKGEAQTKVSAGLVAQAVLDAVTEPAVCSTCGGLGYVPTAGAVQEP